MNNKLEEATIKALQGKLTEDKQDANFTQDVADDILENGYHEDPFLIVGIPYFVEECVNNLANNDLGWSEDNIDKIKDALQDVDGKGYGPFTAVTFSDGSSGSYEIEVYSCNGKGEICSDKVTMTF